MATPRKKVAKAVKKPPARSVPKKAPARSKAPIEPTMTRDVRAAAVDDIPAPYSQTSRTLRFARVMAEIRADGGLEGMWVPLAEFAGRGGALAVKRAMERGDRPVDGELSDWDIEARGNAETGGSVLWARLSTGNASWKKLDK